MKGGIGWSLNIVTNICSQSRGINTQLCRSYTKPLIYVIWYRVTTSILSDMVQGDDFNIVWYGTGWRLQYCLCFVWNYNLNTVLIVSQLRHLTSETSSLGNSKMWSTILLKALQRKNERGYRLKPEYLRSWLKPLQVLSDLPVSRNWYKTVSNLYKNR